MTRGAHTRWAAGLFAALAVASAAEAAPPDLDCELGFEPLAFYAKALPGAETGNEGGFDTVKVSEPGKWEAHIYITTPGHPAHPTIVQRTRRKQVTEVWTADSKGCGYGKTDQFTILMNDMKSGDTELTNQSRNEVEERKRSKSPLAP